MDELNPGIREVVRRLRAAGFNTCDSGDGKTHDHECDRDHAYVVALVDGAQIRIEAQRLRALVISWGVKVHPQNVDAAPCIAANYDPVSDVGVLDLMHVSDAQLRW